MQSERGTTAKWTAEDFLRHAQEVHSRTDDDGFPAFMAATADWTDAEIRAALDEAMLDPTTMLHPGGLHNVLLQEYMRRDVDAAVEWFSAQSAAYQHKMAGMLCYYWPAARALEGVEFVRKNRQIYDGFRSNPGELFWKAAAQVSSQGPAAVAELLKELSDEGFRIVVSGKTRMVEGFDFAGLMAHPAFQRDGSDFVSLRLKTIEEWSKRDRETAFSWLAENGDEQELLWLNRTNFGAQDDAAWFLGKFVALPEERQTKLLEWRAMSPSSAGGDLMAWLDNAPTETLREKIRPLVVRDLFHGKADMVLPVVEAMPNPEARLRLLETTEQNPMSSRQPMAKETAELLRGKLREWGATQERADAILSRYTKPIDRP